MTPENDLPTEDALFDTAVDGPQTSPAETVTPAAPDPAPAAQTTTEQPKTDVTAKLDASTEGSEADEPAMVPSTRLRDVTKEKRAAEAERDAIKQERDALRRERDRIDFERQEFQRRLQAQPKPDAPKEEDEPDPLLHPKEYRQYMERRMDERLLNERREFSLQQAHKVYKEEFVQAYTAAQQLADPALNARMQRSGDPGETLIQWFREKKIQAEVGGDPEAYKKRIIEEDRKARLNDPEFRKVAMETWRGEAPSQTNGRPNVQLAPSLNGISRSNAALRASQQDLSDDALWDSATS